MADAHKDTKSEMAALGNNGTLAGGRNGSCYKQKSFFGFFLVWAQLLSPKTPRQMLAFKNAGKRVVVMVKIQVFESNLTLPQDSVPGLSTTFARAHLRPRELDGGYQAATSTAGTTKDAWARAAAICSRQWLGHGPR